MACLAVMQRLLVASWIGMVVTACTPSGTTPPAAIAASAERPAPEPVSVPVPRSTPQQIAAWLDDHALDGVTIALADHACGIERIAIVAGVACILHPELRCARRASDPEATEAALCGPSPSTIETPAWARVLATVVDDSDDARPIAGSPHPIVELNIDDAIHVVARIGDRWHATTAPVVEGMRPTIIRVLDARPLGHAASLAIVTEQYDGGSEMGELWRNLDILCTTPTGLSPCAGMQIGRLSWALAAADRKNYPNAATSLRGRPHVEFLLDPSIDPLTRTLRLTIELDTRSANLDLDAETLTDYADTRARAGLWRFDGTQLVR